MSDMFEMSNLGKLTYYLGIEVEQGYGFIELKQTSYAKKILGKAGLAECNPTKYPMDPKEQLTKDMGGKRVDVTQFKSLVGGLRYLVHTRPDIAYSVGIVCRHYKQVYGTANDTSLECSKENFTLHKGHSRVWVGIFKEGRQQSVDRFF